MNGRTPSVELTRATRPQSKPLVGPPPIRGPGNPLNTQTSRADTERAAVLLKRLFGGMDGALAIRLWDGTLLRLGQQAQTGEPMFTLVCRSPSVVRSMVLGRDPLRLAEAYIGNRLEQGQLRLDTCDMEDHAACVIDLKQIRNPIVVFASSGDNITPPHQALAWVPAIYPDTATLKAAGQRIIYLLNTHVGHLGLFVSATVAQHEHRAILENVEAYKDLAPGLYEMKIDASADDPAADGTAKPRSRKAELGKLGVRFEERRVEDLQFEYPRHAFEKVDALSQWNESIYRTWVSPWIKASANPVSSFLQKWGLSMRVQRYLFSPQITPAMAWVPFAAAWVKQTRQPVSDDNPLHVIELAASQAIADALEQWRVKRDAAQEQLFAQLYGET